MESKFLKYTVDELAENSLFIEWVKNGTNKKEWKKFVHENPLFSHKVKNACQIVLLLEDEYDELIQKDVLKIWREVDKFNIQHKKNLRLSVIRTGLSWAASILIFISISLIGYHSLNKTDKPYFFAESPGFNSQSTGAKIKFSDGREIFVENTNSLIELKNGKQLIVDKKKIVNLPLHDKKETGINEIIVPYGYRSEILLQDGTRVWLNAGSKFAFPTHFKKKKREVYIEGEACFNVAKRNKNIFVVNAADVDIEVLGTYFNVSAYPKDRYVETVLIEGSVAIGRSTVLGYMDDKEILKPNQKAIFDKLGNKVAIKNQINSSISTSWKEGWMEFSKQDFKSVISRVERYYNVQIYVPDDLPSSEELLISGKMDLRESLPEVIASLADLAKLNYTMSRNKVYFEK